MLDSTYRRLCYTSCGALAGISNSYRIHDKDLTCILFLMLWIYLCMKIRLTFIFKEESHRLVKHLPYEQCLGSIPSSDTLTVFIYIYIYIYDCYMTAPYLVLF